MFTLNPVGRVFTYVLLCESLIDDHLCIDLVLMKPSETGSTFSRSFHVFSFVALVNVCVKECGFHIILLQN